MTTIRPRPWKVLSVSEDRSLLRGLSRFLDVFGFQADEAADVQQALAAWEAKRPDFLIIDGPQALQRSLQQCMSVREMGVTAKVYTLLLTPAGEACEAAASLTAGIDDFLTKPFDYGELLARLQTGARTIEFERRLRDQLTTHPLTGCLTRSALVRRIRAAAAAPRNAEAWCACVAFDLDYFCRVNHIYGHAAGDELLRSVAERVKGHCDHGEALACFGADRFGVFLADANENQAADWAERVRRDLAEAEFAWENVLVRITASFGAAAAKARSLRAEDLVEMASEALRFAKASGRDCVVRYREADEASRAWTDLATPGRLFERTPARNVMVPCPVTLSARDPLPLAVAAFRRTQLPALPVVDAVGKLSGLLLEETVFDELSESRVRTGTVGEAMIADPPRFEETERFATLLDGFTRQRRSVAVITQQGRPTGLVTRHGLATLTTAHQTDSFAPVEHDIEGGQLLVVPELCPTEN